MPVASKYRNMPVASKYRNSPLFYLYSLSERYQNTTIGVKQQLIFILEHVKILVWCQKYKIKPLSYLHSLSESHQNTTNRSKRDQNTTLTITAQQIISISSKHSTHHQFLRL